MADITPTIAALDAALQTARWYSINRHGQAMLCHDERDACATATDCDHVWSLGKPHRPMQLIDAAPVARIVAECKRLAGEVEALREALKSARSDALEDAAQWYMREFGGNPGTVGYRVAGWQAGEIRALPLTGDTFRDSGQADEHDEDLGASGAPLSDAIGGV